MKKFKFTLQSLLNIKILLEKQYMAELAACLERLRLFQEELAAIHTRIELRRNEMRALFESGTTPPELTVYSIGFKALAEKVEEQEQKIEIVRDEISRLREKLVEIMKERKMLEKLSEKQLLEHKELQKAEDAVIIDDFITNKVAMNR